MNLSDLIKQESFPTAGSKALLNILVSQSWILGELAATMNPVGLTPAQYNVLRILRGFHPLPATCSQIGARLLDRTPDVTRLVGRLAKQELVERQRAEHDRRVVEVTITQSGLDLLARLDKPVAETLSRLAKHLDEGELAQLSDMLDRLRTDQT